MIRPPPRSTPFPYPPLSRSPVRERQDLVHRLPGGGGDEDPPLLGDHGLPLVVAVVVGRRHGPAPTPRMGGPLTRLRSEEHTSELQSRQYLVCRLLLEKKKKN